MNPDNPQTPYQPQPGPVQGAQPNPAGYPPAGAPVQPTPPPGYGTPVPMMPASQQKARHSWGLIIAVVVFALGFLISSGFAFWAYAKMQDYKNNVDEKVSSAVTAAVRDAEATKEKEFLERSKSPYKKYKTPATFGSVEITYPRTWAATVDEQGSGDGLVNGYFHPEFVPGPKSGVAFALRIEVIASTYDEVLGSYDSNVKKGTVRVSPFKAERVPQVLGARLDGEVVRETSGSAVLLPLRDKTVRITTYSSQTFGNDFNNVVLKNLIFTP